MVKHLKQGYSLIELTIVVGLISILSIAISAIVLSTIVSSSRIKAQVRIRQTGDYAVGQLQTIIRNSREVSLCETASNSLLLLNEDGEETQLFLEGDQIASNSGVYLTPDDTAVTNFVLTCLPSDEAPELIRLSFTLGRAETGNLRTSENPSENFTTSVELRNR